MTDTYAQLLNSYAHDLQWRLKNSEKETLEELAEAIPLADENKLELADRLSAFRALCCAESFALGIQIGLRLSRELTVF